MITVEFTPGEIDVVANALAHRPYVEVYKVIEKLSLAVQEANADPRDAEG